MRTILALLLISLALVVSDSIENERSKLMGEVMNCCDTVCGTKEFEVLRDKLAIFIGRHGKDHLLESYFARFFDGELCHGKKVSKASWAGISCPYGPYDVADGDVIVNCTFTVYHSAGVYYGSVSAYGAGGGYVSYLGNTGYFYDQFASSPFWEGKVSLVLKQYAAAGNYTVTLYSYAVNYTSYVSAQAVFNVKATLNDAFPPAISSISAPAVNLFDLASASIYFTATDDRSGVSSVSVSIYNGSTTIGYGSYSAPYVNNKPYTPTTLVGSLSIYFYYGVDVRAGSYNFTLYVYDGIGKSKSYSTSDLVALGIQYSIVVDQSYCPAGKYLPSGQVGACISCPFGSFSPNFAFRCKACPAGTWPNGTGVCSPCPAGSYGVGGSSYCAYCPAGYYSSSQGARVCTPCSSGTYSGVGATTCSYCPAGTYSLPASTGSGGCMLCPKGSASSYYYWGCQTCEAGTFAAADGQTNCAQCPPGTYANSIGATACTPCPVGQTGPLASNSPLNCA